MKALNWIAWVSAGGGVILLLLAVVSLIIGHAIFGQHIINFCHAASSLFLLTIVMILFCRQAFKN